MKKESVKIRIEGDNEEEVKEVAKALELFAKALGGKLKITELSSQGKK